MKNALIDFYDSGAISNAKQQLLEDIKNANFAEKHPHVPERRGGEMRTINEVDDIFVLIAFLDERKLLHALPRYVSDNPDNMPSLRLYDGDLKILMTLLGKMDDKLTSHGLAIAAIVSDIHSLQSKPVSSVATANVHATSSFQSVINTTGDNQPLHAVSNVRPGTSTQENPEHGKFRQSSSENTVVNKPGMNWATAASTPAHSRSHVGHVLSTATDDDQSDNQFIEQHSRRFKRTKRKMNNSNTSETVDQQHQQQQRLTSVDSVQPRRRPAVYGRSSDGNAGIAAAKKLVRKAVYCVDNIDTSYNVEDIVRYVNKLGINVVSCFEVKPRHRPSETNVKDRKAFRLCINYDHRERLLDSSRWPDSVIIYEWFFKSQQTAHMSHEAPVEKRQRAEPSPHLLVERSELINILNNIDNDDNNVVVDDGETTMLFDHDTGSVKNDV